MRVGQALGLRHEDVVGVGAADRDRAREDNAAVGAQQGRREGAVPVAAELMRLRHDYMHEEYRELDSDFVFVRLCLHCTLYLS